MGEEDKHKTRSVVSYLHRKPFHLVVLDGLELKHVVGRLHLGVVPHGRPIPHFVLLRTEKQQQCSTTIGAVRLGC
jgi:hypothetical protein